ncbi:5' nucleotidase, deoxy (pyrimidine), cytosolic type C protein [mine drainage metagenome]|uniref:5' nucleotidase, deoxy (Pyrimidine), cytosolic type C protein n=1 Tax=mine drainage metagenome TaxID=410659 RepID=A0A1J5SA02_9ZZZZ
MPLADYPELQTLSSHEKQELIDELRATIRPKRSFIFGVDLDGVVMDFYGGLRPIAATWLGRPVESLSEEFTYGLKEWGLLDRAEGYDLSYEALHRHAINQHELFLSGAPISGAAFQLRRLSRLGVHIRIITHRLYVGGLHEVTVMQTAQWLEKHDIPYIDLCFVKDKTSINADLYIDDSPSNIKAFERANRPCIVFENSTNRHLDAKLRARNWAEVYDLVAQAMGGV